MVSPAPSPNANPIVLYGPASIALRIACLFPGCSVVAFDTDWAAIDDVREAASALGLGDRIHIHHIDAMPRGRGAGCCTATRCAA